MTKANIRRTILSSFILEICDERILHKTDLLRVLLSVIYSDPCF